MKLSKSELIKLLSEHLGSDEDAVSSQLDKLVTDIQKSIAKGDPFVIQGFGTFTDSDEGIHFEVSPAFAAEINYSYEGMLPIDVDGASVPSSDLDSDIPKKPTVKKPVVIVDEDVDGEEDPFGLPEEVEEDVEFVDPVAFLDDLEGRSKKTSQSEEESVFTDTSDEDFAESETEPYGAIKSIDDSVDEEEKQLLESGITLVDHDDDGSISGEEPLTDDPFGIIDEEADISEDPVSIETNVEQESDDTREEVFEEEVTEELQADVEEEVVLSPSEDAELSLDVPPREVTGKTTTVLDEFFDPAPKPEQKLEGVLHDSNDDVDRLLTDGEDPIQDENGPRIVSLEEDKKDYSISLVAIFKWVAIVFVVVLIAGGAYWYLTGPGKSLLGLSNPPVAQTIVTQPDLNESTPSLDQNVLPSDDNQAEIVTDSTIVGVVESTNETGSETPDSTEESTSMSQSTEAVSDMATASTEVSNNPDSTEEIEPQNVAVPTNTEANFGLNGQVQTLSGRVYSIIVHSLPSQVSAQEQCNEISSLNLRCLVREATGPQGRTTYRVGIGQFDSIESAESAIVQLPEPYKSRNFVARVN